MASEGHRHQGLKVVVLNSGSPQPILRTLAMAKYCTISRFIEVGNRTTNHDLLEQAGIPLEFIDGRAKFGLLALWSRLKHEHADVFLCHYAAGSHLNACVLARKHPLAVVAMGNDVLYDEGDRVLSFMEKNIIRNAARNVDFIGAKSHWLKKELRDWGLRCPIDVNYWGVDHTVFSPGDRLKAREALGLPLNGRIVLSMRAFEPNRNVSLVAQAFAIVAQRMSDIHVVFIGVASVPSYVERVRAILKDAGLSSRAHFRFGVSVHEVVSYYRAADVAVSVAAAEGFPNSVLEMLACKTPVIVGRIPQVEELLADEENVTMCSISLDGIVQRLRWVLDRNNEKEILRMVEAGFLVSKEFADITSNSERFVNHLAQLSKSAHNTFPSKLLLELLVDFLIRKATNASGALLRREPYAEAVRQG